MGEVVDKSVLVEKRKEREAARARFINALLMWLATMLSKPVILILKNGKGSVRGILKKLTRGIAYVEKSDGEVEKVDLEDVDNYL